MQPLVSIIIPAYNVGDYIRETLDSLINQTYSNIEIIVVNDGSTDDTPAKAESMSDKRIRVVSQQNGGIGSARNTGIKVSKGDILTFIDGDDIISPVTIEDLVKEFDDPSIDVISYPIMLMWQGDNPRIMAELDAVFSSKSEQYEAFVMGTISYSACNKLYRRSFFDDTAFKEKLLYEDILFWADCIKDKTFTMASVNKGLYYYRHRESSFVNSEVSYPKLSAFIDNSMTIYERAKSAGVNKKKLLISFMRVLDDLIYLNVFSLPKEQQKRIFVTIDTHIPSRFEIFMWRFTLTIGSTKYNQYMQMRKRFSI